MGYFDLSLKNITSAALIAVCAVLSFGAFGQDEQSGEIEIRPADNALAALPVSRAFHPPGKEPVMPRGFAPDALWRDPFALPAEIAGEHKQKAPPKRPDPGTPGPPKLSGQAYTVDLPLLAGIISSGSSQRAIIRHRGLSRVYSEGEQVGGYRLAQITQSTVVLENGAARQIIRLP